MEQFRVDIDAFVQDPDDPDFRKDLISSFRNQIKQCISNDDVECESDLKDMITEFWNAIQPQQETRDRIINEIL